MKTKIKICCIASIEEANIAINEGADALGLVGHMPSGPGTISDSKIKAIASAVSSLTDTFMLTSGETAEAISAHINRTQTTTVQIVRHIRQKESQKLSRLHPDIKRIQVIHMEDETALDLVQYYAPFVDGFLLDSGRPGASIPEFGGTSRTHDWSISCQFVDKSPLPVYLAGGLNSDNVHGAIKMVRPYGVDLCSGVRTDGKLDKKKLRQFIKAVKSV